ncbi:Atu4866 domain-containing protein [Pokkaliibacter sp. CJK22405]|uniref:Atu4866 domain-containing protein n=1 Tax=Pokkaliibacter sp. CJK22405 TaxID=3384615 RepID=UPI003984F42F
MSGEDSEKVSGAEHRAMLKRRKIPAYCWLVCRGHEPRTQRRRFRLGQLGYWRLARRRLWHGLKRLIRPLASLRQSLWQSLAQRAGLQAAKGYWGRWISADGFICQSLLPDGRYLEHRGRHQLAYQGRYRIYRNKIDYCDDAGYATQGYFIDGVLHHAGMILYPESTSAPSAACRANYRKSV